MNKIPYLLVLILFVFGCFPMKSIFLGRPDNKDSYRFDSNFISSAPIPFDFDEAMDKGTAEIKIHDQSKNLATYISLEEFASLHATRAILIIKNDTIKYERYFDGCEETSKEPSYSMAKSFISGLIGIAINDKIIDNENDLVAKYIPEIKQIAGSEGLKIKHLLNHTSGIKYKLSLDAHLYYGNDLMKALKQIEFIEPPGTRVSYLNINSQLLGLILQRSLNEPFINYFERKLWHPLGMESDAFWSTDKNGVEKTFCCLNATSRDYAKFGRLYIKNGIWEGKTIIPKSWITKSISRDTTDGSGIGYNFSWYIGSKTYDDFWFNGMNANYVYLSRKFNTIVVFINDEEKRINSARGQWINKCRQIVDLFN
ncbi:MAG: serine hydrolase [Bacteroidota bacterium]